MATNGKLNITGDGTPLTGNGVLDTQTNRPNSVELTGHATSDLTAPTETHIITATYGGDGTFAGSTSAPFMHTVNQASQVSSKSTLASNLNPSEIGQQVTFSATVASAAGIGGPPTGQVQFYVGGEKMGSPRTLTNGVATTAYNKLVEIRIYTVTASYLGDSQYAGNNSSILNQDVKLVVPPSGTKKILMPLILK